MSLVLAPITLRDANAFVKRLHRHHKPDRGCKFTASVWDDLVLVGVALVLGRLLWLAVADGEGCGCEPASWTNEGKPWVAPLCEAVRCLGLGDHFHAVKTQKAMGKAGIRS